MDFWKNVFDSTMEDWKASIARGDSFERRLVFLRRLDSVIENMACRSNDLINLPAGEEGEDK